MVFDVELFSLMHDQSFTWTLNALSALELNSTSMAVFQTEMLFATLDNNFFVVDQIVKVSWLDVILFDSESIYNGYTSADSYRIRPRYLATAFYSDLILNITTCHWPLQSLFTAEYQDPIATIILISPELSLLFSDYISRFIMFNSFGINTASIMDCYTITVNSLSGLLLLCQGFFCFYIYVVLALVCVSFFLPIDTINEFPLFRAYRYLVSLSYKVRFQLEVLIQTIVFFGFYWGATLMAFDDNNLILVEFLDNVYTAVLVSLVTYLVARHTIHYFSFLEASVVEGRSVRFIVKQIFKDFLNTFAILFRFSILLVRINTYDLLDDFFDSYYVFTCDFNDPDCSDELVSILRKIVFFQDIRAFDYTQETSEVLSFWDDLISNYAFVWTKLVAFTFFLLEELARLSLAFYVCYLIIFEVHTVRCSYNEDLYFLNKRSFR